MIKYNSTTINEIVNLSEGKFNWLKYFDMFGVNFNFSLSKHEKFKSKTGGMWFLNYLLFVTTISIYLIRNYFINPKYIISKIEKSIDNVNEKSEEISLKEENFTFAIKLPKIPNSNKDGDFHLKVNHVIKKYGNISKDLYFLDKIEKDSYEKIYDEITNTTKFIKNIKEKRCEEKEFYTYDINLIDKIFLLNNNQDFLRCYDIQNDSTLAGNFYDDTFKYIAASVYMKKEKFNDTSILESSNDLRIEMFSPLVIINNKNFKTFKNSIENTYEYLDINRKSYLDFYIKRYNLRDDDNYIFKNEDKNKIAKLDKIEKRYKKLSKTKNEEKELCIMRINIRSSNTYIEVIRIRQKILEILQLIGLISVNTYYVMEILISALNTRKAKQHVIEKIIMSKDTLMENVSEEIYGIKDLILRKNEDPKLSESSPFYKNLNKYFVNQRKKLSCNFSSFINTFGLTKNLQKEKLSFKNLYEKNNENNDIKNENNNYFNEDLNISTINSGIKKYNTTPNLTIEMDFVECELSNKGQNKINFNCNDNSADIILEIPNNNKSKLIEMNNILILDENKINIKTKDSSSIIEEKFEQENENNSSNEFFKEEIDKKDISNMLFVQHFAKSIPNHKSQENKTNYNENLNKNNKNGNFIGNEIENSLNNIELIKESNIKRKLLKKKKENLLSKLLNKSPNIINSFKSLIIKSLRGVKKKKIYKFSCRRTFRLLFCCKYRELMESNKEYQKGEKKFNEYIDLVNYLKKMQEIDILKYLLLDENMLNLVRFISRPSISKIYSPQLLDDYRMYFEPFEENIHDIDFFSKLKECYSNLKCKENKQNIEKKIIQLFENQIIDISEYN